MKNAMIYKGYAARIEFDAEIDKNSANRVAARTAAQLVEHWRTRKDRPEKPSQLSLFEMLDME